MEFEELKCPNCDEFFDITSSKTPRLLINCGHSLCESCITNKIIEKDNEEYASINCPECEEVYNQIKSIDQFPKNMTLLKLLNKSSKFAIFSSGNKTEQTLSQEKASDLIEQEGKISLKLSENKINILLSTPPSNNNKRNSLNLNKSTLNTNINVEESTVVTNTLIASSNNHSDDNKKEINESLLNIGQTPSNNRSSLRIGFLLKQDSRLNFNQDRNHKQNNPNISQIQANDPSMFCQVHNSRPLELICLDDKQKICTNCALFGNHKKHNVISEEDFIKEIEVKAEILIELFELIDNYTVSFRDSAYVDRFRNLYEKSHQKQEAIIKQVQDFIQELIKNIKKSEHDIINNIIPQKFEPINKKILDFQETPNELIAKAEEWKSEVQIKLDKLTEINDASLINGFTNDELAKLIEINVTNQETISHAEEISNECEKIKTIPISSIEDLIDEVTVDFNYEMALKLNNLVHILTVQDEGKEKERLKLEESENQKLKEKQSTIEAKNSHRNLNNLIQNISANNNFSMQSIATNTSDTIGNYFAVTENESIPVSGNYSFLNLSEDSAIIRMNTINAANKTSEICYKGKEATIVKQRNSNAGLSTISLGLNTNNNPLKTQGNNKAKTTIYNTNTNANSNFNSNNVNNLTGVTPTLNTIKLYANNKQEKTYTDKQRQSPDRDSENSKSPTPDRDKIVFIKSQLKNDIANFTGYEIGDVGTKILAEILTASATVKTNNPYKAKEIKLTKTNLNDECAFLILKSLEQNLNVITLNIAKNHLTDRCIDAIVSLLNKNKILKTLFMSNNNFSAFAKDRIKSYAAGGKLKIFI